MACIPFWRESEYLPLANVQPFSVVGGQSYLVYRGGKGRVLHARYENESADVMRGDASVITS